MKKVNIMIIGVVLCLAVVGAGFAAEATPNGHPQAVCPVLGGKANKEVYADYQGKRVYFCCPGCIDKFKKNPEKYLKEMEKQGITPEKALAGK